MLSGFKDVDDGSAVVSSAPISGLGSADTAASLAGLGSTFEIGSVVTSICFADGSAVDGSPFKKHTKSRKFQSNSI